MMLDQVFKEQDGEGKDKGLVEQKVRRERARMTEKGRRDRSLFYAKQSIMQTHLIHTALGG